MSVQDLTPDPRNRRSHPDRNLDLITASLQDVGAARSIVIDEDNVILAGNGVQQGAARVGLTKLRIIDTAGDEIIAVRRTGLTDEQKRRLALYDNRTAEVATWDLAQLQADVDAGLDLSPFFDTTELEALLQAAPEARHVEFDAAPPAGDFGGQYGVIVLCGDEPEQQRVYEQLKGLGLTCKVVTT